MTSLFEYQIVETAEGEFMPQRGFPEGSNSITSRFAWRDALPAAAPTRELAHRYVESLQAVDAKCADGKVVWKSPTAP